MGWWSGQAYSQDLRNRVLATVDEGRVVREVAPLFKVSIAYIYKALGQRRATGIVTAHSRGGTTPVRLAGYETALLEHLRANADATLAELRRWLLETRHVQVSVGCLWNTIARLGWTLKKSHSGRRSRIVPMSPRHAPTGLRPSPA